MLIRNRNWKQPTQGKMEMAPMTSTAQFNLRQQLKEELSPLSDAKIIGMIESWKRIQKANSGLLGFRQKELTPWIPEFIEVAENLLTTK